MKQNRNSVTIHPTLTYCCAEPPTLEHAQDVVGGWVECIYLPGDAQLLVNEEGRRLGLPVNEAASAIAGRMILGNAMLLQHGAQWRGDSD